MGWPGENGVSFAMSRVVCGERPDRDLQASASPLDGVEVVEGRWMILTSRTHYWRWEWTQTDERFFCERTAQEDWNPVILLLIIKTYRRHLAQKTYFEHSMFFLSALAWFIVRTSTIETFFITIRTLLARAADLTCVLVTAAGDDDSQTRTLTSSTPANPDLIGKGQRCDLF